MPNLEHITGARHVCSCGKAWAGHAADRDLGSSTLDPVYPPDLLLEPVHLDLALTFDLEAERLDGVATHTVQANRAGERRIRLDAVGFAAISARDAHGRALESSYDGLGLEVRWAEPFALGERRELVVEYRVEHPVAGLYFSRPTAEVTDAPWFAATDNETERARHWLPTIDLPSVRPTLSFALTADARFTALANGTYLGEEVDAASGRKTTRWRLEQRCPSYLTCVAVAEFVRFDDGEFAGIPVAAFTAPPFTVADLERGFGRTRAMLEWMTARLGVPFPFPKYFQFALPNLGGAMENISLVAWDDFAVLDEVIATELTQLVDEVNVHEMAHSYFGDLVVCRDFAHAWLKESWATYMQHCWLEDSAGRDAADYAFYSNVRAYISEADGSYLRPIVTRRFASSWDMYDRHLYPGGAARLHMLRAELGDEVFWPAVRLYLERYSYRTVETDDFRRTLEEVSGRSLGPFFDQWFHGLGYPHLEVTFTYDADKARGTFEVTQKQIDEEKGVRAFDLRLELGWVIDGVLEVEEVRVQRASETFYVAMPREPEQVRVDPNARVLLKLDFNPGDDKLRRQLSAPDVIGRIRAGLELLKTGRQPNLEAVHQAWASETFWGVRTEWATALAQVHTDAAVELLADIVRREQHPYAMQPVFMAAGALRDPRIAAALLARIDEGTLPYRAEAAAWEGLGRQREDAPFDRLVERVGRESYKGIVQNGAARGLAAARHPRSAEVLLAHLEPGRAPLRSRPWFVRALGTLAAVLERAEREQVIDALVARLRDPDVRVRLAATEALAAARAVEAIPALEAFKRGTARQEEVAIERLIKQIRRAADTRDQLASVDKLEETVRKLEGRIARLEARDA